METKDMLYERLEDIPAEKLTLAEHTLGEYAEEQSGKVLGFFADSFLRLCKNKAAITALIIILLIMFMAIFGPSMNPYGYNDQDVDRVNLPPRVSALARFGILDGSMVTQLSYSTQLYGSLQQHRHSYKT